MRYFASIVSPTCGALVVGGLPKESTEDRYCDSIDGDELPRDPLSGSPGNPWYISPEGPKENLTPAVTGDSAMSPGRTGQRHAQRKFIKDCSLSEGENDWCYWCS